MTIRLAGPEDAARVAEIYAPHVSGSAVSFELESPSVSEMARRIESTLAYAPWLVVEQAGEVLGFSYGSAHRERAAYRWSVDVSVYVAPSRQGRGIGRALYTTLLRLLPLQRFCVAHAGIALPNAASVALHEALGFQPVGVYAAVGFKLGAWHDVGWWRLALRDRPADPGEILTLDEVRSTPEWVRALSGQGVRS